MYVGLLLYVGLVPSPMAPLVYHARLANKIVLANATMCTRDLSYQDCTISLLTLFLTAQIACVKRLLR
jgi:hypothetical protein